MRASAPTIAAGFPDRPFVVLTPLGCIIMTIHEMQNLARSTLAYCAANISPGMSLPALRRLCETYMLEHGADSFWYWDVGAFVFSGTETSRSVSGRRYQTSNRVIAADDIITIDLSPQHAKVWGDFARTLIIEDGRVVTDPTQIQNEVWRNGLATEDHLHQTLFRVAQPDTTFEELFYLLNREINVCGYQNLDFLGNLGHSIEKDKQNRIYIEKGNQRKLSSVEAFTFEPHIGLPKSAYGFKKEDIYTFVNGQLVAL